MTAGYGLAGAPSSGVIHAVAPGVCREVAARVFAVARPTKGRLSGSSRMTRKCQVRFLGGWGAAMPPGYPTKNMLAEETDNDRDGCHSHSGESGGFSF